MATSFRSHLLLGGAVAFASFLMISTPVLADTCPDGDTRTVRVAIDVSMDPPDISVDQLSVTIFRRPELSQPKRVCWVVTGLSATTRLLIEPKNPGAVDPFPVLIRRLTSSRTFANSGNPTVETTWRYGLRLVDASGATLKWFDPEVIVKGRGG